MAVPAWWILALFYFASCPEVNSQKITPLEREQTVKLGESAHLVCQYGGKLETCLFDLPSGKSISPRPGLSPFNGIIYYGKGLEQGECGIEIRAASESHNGEYTCTLTPSTSVESYKTNLILTVAKAPGLPELAMSRGSIGDGSFREGDTLNATCRVNGGRPAANLSWYIGDERITNGLSLASTVAIPQQGLFNIQQNLTHLVRSTDNGKQLKCVAEHPLLKERNSTVRSISVLFAPKPHPDKFEYFELVEGAEGRVSVSVEANPRPSFTWVVDQDFYFEGDSDPEKPFYVLPAMSKGNGFWDSVMVIRTLSKEDTERHYLVKASNKFGDQEYQVNVSTNPRPSMMLGIGTILGIIFAVLLVLTIASVLVFARAKGRWCFAAKKERSSQVPGESSDTESADHHKATSAPKGGSNGGKPKMSFKLTFKKPPKPSPEEAAEMAIAGGATQNDNQDKDNGKDDGDNEENRLNPPLKSDDVVYAELDLQNAQGARARLVRPEDEKTEYAEIIHKDPPKKK